MKLYFETYGCTSNRADTEIMEGLVEDSHEIVGRPEDCDVAVINSCGVIDGTTRKVMRRVREMKGAGKRVVLAGCLPRIDPDSLQDCRPDFVLGPDSIGSIGDVLGSLEDGNDGGSVQTLKVTGFDKAAARRRPDGSVIRAIPIAEGCLGGCSYCGTRFARGRLHSYAPESIEAGVRSALSWGCREIQLTAQDTGAYGADIGTDLAELINRVCMVEGDFRIRVGMMNPAHLMGFLDDLIEAFANEKVYKFLHLPVQSGDDRVLQDMRRGYGVEEFTEIVQRFRKAHPGLTLSTDVIIGYPTEDEEAFERTYRLIERIGPDILNITRFSPRPGTPAARLRDMPDRIKKERSRRMSILAREVSSQINRGYVGREEQVLVTEYGKKGTLLARTHSYKQVVLREGVPGEFRRVRIKDSTAHYLVAG